MQIYSSDNPSKGFELYVSETIVLVKETIIK